MVCRAFRGAAAALLFLPLLGSGCGFTPARISDPEQGEARNTAAAIAREEVGRLGLTIKDMIVAERRTSGPFDDNNRVTGFDVWVDVTSCDTGSVVVNLDDSGRLIEVYTRYGCRVPGLPAF